MSTTLSIKSDQDAHTIFYLIKTTIDAEIMKLTLALKMANKRLQPFEEKYHVSSEYFIAHLAAEDLDGGDDEYITWAGEYQLKQRLLQKICQLQDIEYDRSVGYNRFSNSYPLNSRS